MTIDFDEIDDWIEQLRERLRPHMQSDAERQITALKLKYVEDARDALLKLGDRDAIIHATLDWILENRLAAFHGTRLTDEEVQSVLKQGLRPLDPNCRKVRLERALSKHPRWSECVCRLDEELSRCASGRDFGVRVGQVHLTLSQAGLKKGFNHYLIFGAEFDQHVAQALLGEEGLKCLARDGKPRVVRVQVPGKDAITAAHPYFSVAMMRERGELPNIVNQFLQAFAFRLIRPNFQAETLLLDCGMVFERIVPPDWGIEVETLELS